MRSLYLYGLMRYANILILGLLIPGIIIYLMPLAKALFSYEKKRWLQRYFDHHPTMSEDNSQLKKDLLEAAEPEQSHPFYKLFKYYFLSFGILAIVSGLLIIVLPHNYRKVIDWLIFVPLIVGIVIYFLHATLFKNSGLWREIGAIFLQVGFVATAIMAYGNFDMYKWLRADMFSFIVLGIAFLVVYKTKAIFASLTYMGLVSIAASTTLMSIEYNWMMFFPRLLWVFGIAILIVWIPKLKNVKEISAKEILFGVSFSSMILQLTFTQTSSLFIPALAVVLPSLYVFSKTYYHKALLAVEKPIEYIVILIIMIMSLGLTVNSVMAVASDSIYIFTNFSIHKLVSIFILIGLAIGTFYIYSKDGDEGDEHMSLSIIMMPIVLFFITYMIGEYSGHYIVSFLLLMSSIMYIRRGIDRKQEFQVIAGALLFVNTILIKIVDIFQMDLFREKLIMGLFVVFVGILYVGIVAYIRKQWAVTSSEQLAIEAN